MGLLDECKLLFGTNDLYQLLNIAKECTESDIKRAYRKLSLNVHPDRVSADLKENATKKFQVLSKVSRILLDKDLRSLYDDEGEVDDDIAINEKTVNDWSQYWKAMFNLSIDDMKKFEEEYRFSPEETDDLTANYVECKGDMDLIFENQVCSHIEDEERFRKILQGAIDSGAIPSFDIFTNEPKLKRNKRKKFYEKEKKEAEAELKRQKIGKFESESDLEKLILSRQQNRKKEMDSFLNNLEAKYVKPCKSRASSSKSKKKKTKAN